MHPAQQVWAFIRLGRLTFLIGGFVLHGLGVAMAIYRGAALDLLALLWGQIAITATQLMTHYSNDYFDLAADRANQTPTRWSGGSRVLPENRLPPWVALATALTLAVIVMLASLILATQVRSAWLTLPLLLTALALAWFYSAPPLRLHSRGWGELTTAILVPGLTSLVGFYLQAGRIEALPLLAAFPLGCLQFAMLLAIEFPDAAGDEAANKRTLVVRLSPAGAARLHNRALLLAYASLPLLALAGLPLVVAVAFGLTLPFALWQGWRVAQGHWAQPSQWNRLGFWDVALLMAAAVAELAAFVGLIGTR